MSPEKLFEKATRPLSRIGIEEILETDFEIKTIGSTEYKFYHDGVVHTAEDSKLFSFLGAYVSKQDCHDFEKIGDEKAKNSRLKELSKNFYGDSDGVVIYIKQGKFEIVKNTLNITEDSSTVQTQQ